MDSIVYLSYGGAPHNDELVYSALSALHAMGQDVSDYRIIVYTDTPDAFGELPVHIEPLTETVLADWARPVGYNPRRKILAIKNALEKFRGRLL